MWYIITVGGCGGMLYMTHNKYVKDLPGASLWYSYNRKAELDRGYSSIIREKMGDLEPLFSGVKIDADKNDAEGKKFNKHIDKKIVSYSVREKREKRKPYECPYYIYREIPSELGKKIERALGEDFIEKGGFAHSPEQQMICLAINEILDHIMGNIDRLPEIGEAREGDGILFMTGLGGGTGTGMIETIAKEIFGYRPIPSIALVVLSGKGDTSGQRPYCRRCFNLIWALNNLIASKALDGVILVDNNVLNEKLKDKMAAIDREREGLFEKPKERKEWRKRFEIDHYIIERIFPLFMLSSKEGRPNILIEFKDTLNGDLNFTPVLVPCFKRGKGDIEELIKDAIDNEQLANCKSQTDNREEDNPALDNEQLALCDADKTLVLIRNETKSELKEEELKKLFSDDKAELFDVDPVIGIKEDEVLVLLRNPDVHAIFADRLEIAGKFAELIKKIGEKSGGKLDEARSITVNEPAIENLIQELEEYGADEKDIFERWEGRRYVEIMLDSAIEFLYPGDREKPFKYMQGVVDRYIEEVQNIKERLSKNEKSVFKSLIEFEGIEMYLFSIDAKATEEFDLLLQKDLSNDEWLKDGNNLEKLRAQFEREGYPLSENPALNGQGSGEIVIKDSGRSFIVRMEDGKLNVYGHETKREESIKRADIERIIEEKIKSLPISTGNIVMGPEVPIPTPSGDFDSILDDIEMLKEEVKSSRSRSENRASAIDLEKIVTPAVTAGTMEGKDARAFLNLIKKASEKDLERIITLAETAGEIEEKDARAFFDFIRETSAKDLERIITLAETASGIEEKDKRAIFDFIRQTSPEGLEEITKLAETAGAEEKKEIEGRKWEDDIV
jgi:hypothetical protein